MKGNLKSQRSIMLNLTKGLLRDFFVHHQLPPRDFDRDFLTIKTRTEAEGLSFLTKTLPQLAKALDAALLKGLLKTPSSFKKKTRSNLPCFMHGFFSKVFDQDGVLLDEPDICAIKDLRQMGYLFYKYQLPYKESLVDHLFKEFAETDKDIQTQLQTTEQMATVYYAKEVIDAIFKDFSIDSLRPKNGPGSVANSIPQWERYKPTKFYPCLDDLVDYSKFFYYNDRHLFDQFTGYWNLDYEFSGRAKSLAVPKDSRGPRLISSEPSEFMTYQQALKNVLVPFIESNVFTRGRVNFTRQDINGNLALESSKSGEFATLDLEKASDLVSLCLVDLLFEDTCIHRFLMNARSSETELPSGELIPLNKFAPMGSALCFPIEAITFFAVIAGARLARGIPLNEATKDLYVYGDDIIVPTHEVSQAIDALTNVGLRVNMGKSCFSGKFRESCGVDAYNGVDVTPIKIKKTWQENPTASDQASWVAVANNLFVNGYWKASDVVRRSLEKVVGLLPLRTQDSPVMGWTTWTRKHAFLANLKLWRWNHDLQKFMMRAPIVISKTLHKLIDGWKRLLRDAWYRPEMYLIDPLDPFEFDSAAFSLRYQAIKRSSWIGEDEV
jgi:hypothetical protein